MTARTASGSVSSRYAQPDAPDPAVRVAGIKRGRRVVSSSEDDADQGSDEADSHLSAASAREAVSDYEQEGAVFDLSSDPDEDTVSTQPIPPIVQPGLKLKLRFNPSPPVASTSRLGNQSVPRSKKARGKRNVGGMADEEIDELADERVDMDEEHASYGSVSEDDLPASPHGRSGTARQRAINKAGGDEDLLQLPDVMTGKKVALLTDLEKANRREENARRRKLQADQKQENDKTDAINRLLKASSGRSRTKLHTVVTGEASRDASPVPEGRQILGSGLEDATEVRSTSFRHVSSTKSGTFTLVLGVPASEIPPRWDIPSPPKPVARADCHVDGCSKLRQYRSTKNFDRGACSMGHLKLVENDPV